MEVYAVEFKTVIKYAFLGDALCECQILLSQVDMQMVVYMLGTKDAGYYSNYLSMLRIPYLFLLPVFIFCFLFYWSSQKDDHKKLFAIHAFCYELFYCRTYDDEFSSWFWWHSYDDTFWFEFYDVSAKILLYSAPFCFSTFSFRLIFKFCPLPVGQEQKMLPSCMSLTQSLRIYIYTVVVSFGSAFACRYRMALYGLWLLSDKKFAGWHFDASFSTKSGWHWFCFLGRCIMFIWRLIFQGVSSCWWVFSGHYFIRNSICSI